MSAPTMDKAPPGGFPLWTALAIERDWSPDRAGEYANALRATARDLAEGRHHDVWVAWAMEHLGALLNTRDDEEREARQNAFADLVADAPTWLRTTADHVDPDKPANLASFAKAKMIWATGDQLESLVHRHRRQAASGEVPDLPAATVDLVYRVLANHVLSLVDDIPCAKEVVRGLMEGETIAEMARRTGKSRQAIYRLLAGLREWISGQGTAPFKAPGWTADQTVGGHR